MGLVADMQGAVMLTVVIWGVHGYVICIQQSTGWGVRIQQSTVGPIQHQQWVAISDVLITNQQRTCGYLHGKGSRIRTWYNNTYDRTTFGFQGEYATEGRDFDSPKVCVSIMLGSGSMIQLPYNLYVYGFSWGGLMNCNAWNDVRGVPCVWGLERYVRNVNQKAKKRIHGTERKRLSHWFFIIK